MKTIDDSPEVKKAWEALDGMSETWAEREGIWQAIKKFPVNCTAQEHIDRSHGLFFTFAKQAYAEGLYNGRMSHTEALRDAAVASLLPAAVKALEEAHKVIGLCTTGLADPSPHYQEIIRKIGDAGGYGNLMSTASRIWFQKAEADNLNGSNHTCGPCQTTVDKTLTRLSDTLTRISEATKAVEGKR